MLRKLLGWDEVDEKAAPKLDPGAKQNRRREDRLDMRRVAVTVRDRRSRSTFHLRDMSCTGASGISDIPLAVGSVVFVRLYQGRYRAAEVRWVRNALTGLRFLRPLELAELDRLRRSRKRQGEFI